MSNETAPKERLEILRLIQYAFPMVFRHSGTWFLFKWTSTGCYSLGICRCWYFRVFPDRYHSHLRQQISKHGIK